MVPRLLFALGALVGVALAVAGGVLLAQDRPAGFGWTAYAPLSRTAYLPPTSQPLGLALLVVGAVLIGSGVTGALLVRRR